MYMYMYIVQGKGGGGSHLLVIWVCATMTAPPPPPPRPATAGSQSHGRFYTQIAHTVTHPANPSPTHTCSSHSTLSPGTFLTHLASYIILYMYLRAYAEQLCIRLTPS